MKTFDVFGGDGAEKALVGALLINPRNLPEAASVINESDFRRRDLAAIYRAIVALSAAGQRVDTITVSNALATCGDIEERADALVTSLVAYSPSLRLGGGRVCGCGGHRRAGDFGLRAAFGAAGARP